MMITKILDMVSFLLRKAVEGMDWEEARAELMDNLVRQGYGHQEIDMALNIAHRIQERMDAHDAVAVPVRSNRVFEVFASWRIPLDLRGYLVGLEHRGVLTPCQRETIVERLLMVDPDELDLDVVKAHVGALLADDGWGWITPGGEPTFH